MSKAHIYARNLAANWIGYGANLVLTLATSWFVFRLLGDVRYGVWSLMMSLTGYLGMVDLGLRPALYRYFNWHLGRGEPERLNQVLCTSLAFFVVACAVLLGAGAILGAFFGQIFPNVPPEHLAEVRVAAVLMAANVGLAALAGIFGSLLETHERYDLSNALDVAAMVVRSAGSILAIYLGFGLIGLAVACVGATVLAGFGGYVLARRAFRAMALRFSYASRATLAELLRFGIPCFFSGIGIRLISLTSPLLIAWLIGMSAVGYYSLAMALLEHGRALAQKAGTIFTPGIQQSVARADYAGLRYLVPLVSGVTMAISVPVLVGIMVFGKDFLAFFYSPAAAEAGGLVLVFLGVGFLAASSSQQCAAVLIGAGRIRLVASIVLAEAMLNLGLTVLLVSVAGMGLAGVAAGAAIPMVFFSGLLLSALGAGHIGMGLGTFARRTAAYWVPAAGAFGLVCLGLQRGLHFASWGGLATKVAAASILYIPIAWYALLPHKQKGLLRAWLGRLWFCRKGWEPGSATQTVEPPEKTR